MTGKLQEKDNITTNRLLKMIQERDASLTLLDDTALVSGIKFTEYLQQKMDERHVSAAKLMTDADISKTYIYQILRGERRPRRDTALRIALALKLKTDEVQRILTLSGNNVLYPRVRRDAAILFARSHGMSLLETEELLLSLGEQTLFSQGDL